MLAPKTRYHNNLQNYGSYEATITNKVGEETSTFSMNWTDLLNETSKLSTLLAYRIREDSDHKLYPIKRTGTKARKPNRKELIVTKDDYVPDTTESMDEVINLSTAFAGGDYTSIEYDPEYYNDYYDYNPEDYNHLDPQHLQQLQPDDGIDTKLTNSLIYLIQKERLQSKLRRFSVPNKNKKTDCEEATQNQSH